MKRITRKMYLSLILVLLSLLTMVATTFAWVGIITNNTFERISISLETDNEESDYGVQLSLTGASNDFHDSIEPLDLQKRLLLNMGFTNEYLKNEYTVQDTFNKIKLSQCTTVKDWDDNGTGACHYLDPFLTKDNKEPYATLNYKDTNYLGYFEFDIWVSIFKIGDVGTGSNNKLDIYLRDGENGLFSSEYASSIVPNYIKFPDSSNPLSTQYLKAENNFEPGKTIKGDIKINPAGAARLSVQKASSVPYGDNTNSLNNGYKGLKIYKYGSDYPSYDSKLDLYDFGGILPSEYNFARLQYNSTHEAPDQLGEVPTMALPEKRGDVTFVDDGDTNHIVDSNDSVTINDMIKIHFTFWFEGWDSDCFEAVNDVPVSVSLNFSTKNPNEQNPNNG